MRLVFAEVRAEEERASAFLSVVDSEEGMDEEEEDEDEAVTVGKVSPLEGGMVGVSVAIGLIGGKCACEV